MITFLSAIIVVLIVMLVALALEYRKSARRIAERTLEIVSLKSEVERARNDYQAELAQIAAKAEKALRAGQVDVEQQLGHFNREADRVRKLYEAEARRVKEAAESTVSKLLHELEPLRRFQSVADAEGQAKTILADTIVEAEKLRERVLAYEENSRKIAETEREAAISKAQETRRHAEVLLSQATREAGSIVRKANDGAMKIAGDAYLSLQEKQQIEQALLAIRNIVDGYGDRYIVPTRSLLDDLAADFGHTEAGMALAMARDQTRRLVTDGEAAACNYVEEDRKETAIRFVIDAFNGRIEAILSRTKHDNFGTLEQEIRDSFALVNLHGKAFRDARILPMYLDARLAELKWAVVAQELRMKEREEQRRIKEQIREEEKARREYERAMQEAQREEEILTKALERARQEASQATQEQKAKFDQEIALLNKKLQEAEERNQRALSMAQQTRKGNVYIISNIGAFGEEVFKIGMTRRLEPLDRVKELGDASVPFEFDVHAIIPSEDAPALENLLHNQFEGFRVNQVNYRKEFFRLPIEKVREFVQGRGVDASFTMLAQAKEFRESQRLLQMSPEEREKYWVKQETDSKLIRPPSEGRKGAIFSTASNVVTGI